MKAFASLILGNLSWDTLERRQKEPRTLDDGRVVGGKPYLTTGSCREFMVKVPITYKGEEFIANRVEVRTLVLAQGLVPKAQAEGQQRATRGKAVSTGLRTAIENRALTAEHAQKLAAELEAYAETEADSEP